VDSRSTHLNDLDRFHLVIDVIHRTGADAARAVELRSAMQDARRRHARYNRKHGEDLPEIRDWRWPG
jgi:xylulose-5-phosphate/fructose-6-phosphate phosphoketolase